MSRLDDAVSRFLTDTADTSPDLEAVQGRASAVMQAARSARPEDLTAVLGRLAPALEHADARVGGTAAIMGGALVEQGAPPGSHAPALLARLPDILTAAVRFVERCEAALPPPADGNETEDQSGNGLWVGGRRVPNDVAQEAAQSEPDGARAIESLEMWCLPTIACLTREAALRRAAKESYPHLLPLAERLSGEVGAAESLRKLLSVLDDEPLLVVHVESGRAFRCRIGGIADNFQLHTLLAAALIPEAPRATGGGLLSRLFGRGGGKEAPATDTVIAAAGLTGKRPDEATIAVARGDGPLELPRPVEGIWEMFQWTALDRAGRLPEFLSAPFMEHKVWHEGTPSDVALFEGQRILLLGFPGQLQRSWSNNRHFSDLRAYCVNEGEIPAEEARLLLARLAAASPRASEAEG
jgi:hypothetical protein